MQKNFWEGKRVLVSGSSGFIGRHLLEFVKQNGAIVTGLTRSSNIHSYEIQMNLTDNVALLATVKKTKPDVFFHLAGEAIVESGQENPYETFYNNIVSALNVLEVSRLTKIARIVIASTVHVYGDGPSPYKEDEPARPSRPYETSKTSVDLIAQSYADTYGLPVLIPRFVNIYGPGDTNVTRIVPKTVRAALAGERPTLWGGNAKRDYLYIDDAIRAYDLLCRIPDGQLERNRIFNFATGHPVSARKLIGAVLAALRSDVSIKRIPHVRKQELSRQDVNWQKAKRVLGWTPTITLEEGLYRTVSWYQAHQGQW